MSTESYYDNDDDGNVFEPSTSYNSKNKKSKLKKNVNGPYNVILTIQGIEYDITIDNITTNEFEITINSDSKPSIEQMEVVKSYLEWEGFEDAARKHNLFW